MSEIKNGRVRHEGALTGQMNLKSDLVALVADGDVTVQGKGQEDGTRVQGLVYTKASFKAQDSTIVGAVVSARVDGTTELDRVNMVQIPGVTDFEVVVDQELKVVTEPGRARRLGYGYGLHYQGAFIPFLDSNAQALRALAESIADLSDEQRGTVGFCSLSEDGAMTGVVPDGQVPEELLNEKNRKFTQWDTYLDKVKDGTVDRTEIFKLDLNSFISAQGELEVLMWKSHRQRLKEQEES